MFPGKDGQRGAFVAWDPTTGIKRWELKENLAAYGGALATAGGLVFYGTMEGWAKAGDSPTGPPLLKVQNAPGTIGKPPNCPSPQDKQNIRPRPPPRPAARGREGDPAPVGTPRAL